MTDYYGVMGHPIEHSKSPFIHARFAEQTGQSMVYRARHVVPGDFARAIAAFQVEGGKGLSITLPFKEEALALVDTLTPRARRANAVNTIGFDHAGNKHGDNTDGIGLIRDLRHNHAIAITGLQVLLVGAGGAAKGIIGPLFDQSPERLVVANRTPEKAHSLIRQFRQREEIGEDPARLPLLTACGLNELGTASFDLIINATAASLEGKVAPLPDTIVRPQGVCYDLMYSVAQPTAFVLWGREHGAALAVDGLGMLVEQAAEAFQGWRGVRPDTAPVIRALRL
uniref:Shikimate dehydrogenase (NADP(+)) n=1 Tax=Candidatus Kentrum sp. DK TaxID=2126562 RepID=A0A450RX68_9GAMM|nr:MAG: shikimate dehydrogenase [Candidatus Kentron sp. DK]